MRRHSKEGREPVKARRRKAVLKRRNGPKASRPRASSSASLHKQVFLLAQERDEALARQTATADILRVISQSPNDERPVFDSIVLTAARLLLCDLYLCCFATVPLTRTRQRPRLRAASRTMGQRVFRSIPTPISPHARLSTEKCCTSQIGL